jgi:hypothetical protein
MPARAGTARILPQGWFLCQRFTPGRLYLLKNPLILYFKFRMLRPLKPAKHLVFLLSMQVGDVIKDGFLLAGAKA